MNNSTHLDPFMIIGIAVRTTNAGGKAGIDLKQLWGRFYAEDIPSKIPNRAGDDVYSIYTDYESDYRGGYTTIIGCRVTSLSNIPPGMEGRFFAGGQYSKFTASGKMPDAIVTAWKNIWDMDRELKRKYTADFEVYGPKCQDPLKPEVDIYLAVD